MIMMNRLKAFIQLSIILLVSLTAINMGYPSGFFWKSDSDRNRCIDRIHIENTEIEASATRYSFIYSTWIPDSYNDFHYGLLHHDNLLINGTGSNASLALSPRYNWTEIIPPTSPATRYGHGMTYDPSREIIVLFGGNHYVSGGQFLNDTWIYDIKNNTWTQKFPAVSPSARMYPAMVYDPLNSVVVLFGGSLGDGISDTWIYHIHNNTWIEMSPNVQPPKRGYAAITYNHWNNTVMLFGGRRNFGRYLDTWFYDTAQNNWTEMKPKTNPKERSGMSMCYDEKNDKVIMFGGDRTSNDTWVYDPQLNNWTEMFPKTHPPARDCYTLGYSSGKLDGVLLFGGYDWPTYYNDNWLYNYSSNNWTQLTPSMISMREREGAAMIYDDNNDAYLLFGGRMGPNSYRSLSDIQRFSFESYDLSQSGYFRTSRQSWDGRWHTLYVDKEEPPGTHINISVCDYYTGDPIPGFENRSETNIDLETINDMNMSNLFYMEGWFSAEGNVTPSLDYWGMTWVKEEAWKDSFYNKNKIGNRTNTKIEDKAKMKDITKRTAYLDSEVITLPSYYSWRCLDIEKSEPENTFLNITLINAITGNPIVGFIKINSSGITDISSIDPHLHNSIIINATFVGNGTNTPVLKSWGLGWMNTNPEIGKIKGFNNMNRTETLVISVRVTDKEEYNDNLNLTVNHRLNGEDKHSWVDSYITGTYANSKRIFCNFTPPADAPLSSYDFRFLVKDSLGRSSGSWVTLNNALNVYNNPPVFDGIELGKSVLNWTSNSTITVLNISDIETNFMDLDVSVSYRINNTQKWDESFITDLGWNENNYSVRFTPDSNASLGKYDIQVNINDLVNLTTKSLPNKISVTNSHPLMEEIHVSSHIVYRTNRSQITIINITDEESPIPDINISVSYRLNGTQLWQNSSLFFVEWQGNDRIWDFIPDSNASLGLYDIRITLDDGKNSTTNYYYNEIRVENNLPVFQGLNISETEVFRNSNSILTLSDFYEVETAFNDTVIKIEYRLNGTSDWYDNWIDRVDGRTINISFQFTPNINAELGYYDFRISLDDGDNITEAIYPNAIFVKNNLPTIEGIEPHTETINRSKTLDIVLIDLYDVETSWENIDVSPYYRLNGTSEWNNSGIFLALYRSKNLTVRFIPNIKAPLGMYDLKIVLNDSLNTTIWKYSNFVRVVNNRPSLSKIITSPEEVFRTEKFELTLSNIRDTETSNEDLDIAIWIRDNDTEAWTDLDVKLYDRVGFDITYDNTQSRNVTLGWKDIHVSIFDGDDTIYLEFYNVFKVLNLPPSISWDLSRLILTENHEKTFSLLDWCMDEKDLPSSLKWDYDLSTVNLNLIDWIWISGYNVTIKPISGSRGTNDVKFRVMDPDGGNDTKYLRIDVRKSDQKLETTLVSPVNNYILRSRNVNLTWDTTWTDTESPPIFDIYLGNEQNAILECNKTYMIESTSNSYYISDDLTRNHERYYWSVIPRNSSSTGYCIQGFSCIYTDFNNPPTTVLISPEDDSVLEDTSGRLEWSSLDLDDDEIGCMVYLSYSQIDVKNRDPNSLLTITNLDSCPLPPLRINMTYYWTVIPYDSLSFGSCENDVWSFNVDVENVDVPSMNFTSSVKKILTGESATFNIHPINSDEEITYRLDFGDGNFSKWSSQTILAHRYLNPGTHRVRLSLSKNNIEVPLPNIIEIEVIDISTIELELDEIEKTKESSIILKGRITGVDWISRNLSLELTINGYAIPIHTESNWSFVIDRNILVEGENNLTVSLEFKDHEMKAVNTTVNMEFSEEGKSNAMLHIGIGSGILVMIIIAVISFIIVIRSRRKKEREDKTQSDRAGYEEVKDDVIEGPDTEELGETIERKKDDGDKEGGDGDWEWDDEEPSHDRASTEVSEELVDYGTETESDDWMEEDYESYWDDGGEAEDEKWDVESKTWDGRYGTGKMLDWDTKIERGGGRYRRDDDYYQEPDHELSVDEDDDGDIVDFDDDDVSYEEEKDGEDMEDENTVEPEWEEAEDEMEEEKAPDWEYEETEEDSEWVEAEWD